MFLSCFFFGYWLFAPILVKILNLIYPLTLVGTEKKLKPRKQRKKKVMTQEKTDYQSCVFAIR